MREVDAALKAAALRLNRRREKQIPRCGSSLGMILLPAKSRRSAAVLERRVRRDPSLTLFTQDDFVTREKRILLVAFSRKTGRIVTC
jgi:hypothetical protein